MITSKYNFRQWLAKAYPDVIAKPVYGLPAYILSKALEPVHMYEYNIQQLPNGTYIVFIGVLPEDVPQMMAEYNKPRRLIGKGNIMMPTTFASFENWIRRNGKQYMHRTYIQMQTANEALFTHFTEPEWNTKGTWYLYEFEHSFDEEQMNPRVPCITTSSGTTALLIKASPSQYVSKKQLFLRKFALMQPLQEQIVVALAQDDDDKAKALAEQFMGIQFDTEGTIDIDKMKEAYHAGTLNNWLRIRANITVTH